MEIKIISKEGEICNLNVEADYLIEKLKFMALGHFGAFIENIVEKERASTRFKLILVRSLLHLNDKKTVGEEGLKENDEILLSKKPPVFYDDKKDFSMGPSLSEVIVATASLPQNSKNDFKPIKPYAADFHDEIKRVLITLLQTSHNLICLNSQASKIFDEWLYKMQSVSSFQHNRLRNNSRMDLPANSMLFPLNVTEAHNRQPLPCASEHSQNQIDNIDKNAVNLLKEMGFNEKQALRALISNKMNIQRAAEWLLENSEVVDPNLERTKRDDDISNIGDNLGSLPKLGSRHTTNDMPCDNTKRLSYNPHILSIENDTPAKIIQAFRAFKLNKFKIDDQALNNLKDMGFNESDASEALTVCNNSEDAACEWLLCGHDIGGSKNGKLTKSSTNSKTDLIKPGEDFRGLSENSATYKAFLSDPTILLGLNNPKMLLVLLNIYESFVQTGALHIGRWFNDPDATVLLSQIFRIYHAEKYSLNGGETTEPREEAMNQNNPNQSNQANSYGFGSGDTEITSRRNNLQSTGTTTDQSHLSEAITSQLRQTLSHTLQVDTSYPVASPHSNINIIMPPSAIAYIPSADLANIDSNLGQPTGALDFDDYDDGGPAEYYYDGEDGTTLMSDVLAVAASEGDISSLNSSSNTDLPLSRGLSAHITSTFRDYADLDRYIQPLPSSSMGLNTTPEIRLPSSGTNPGLLETVSTSPSTLVTSSSSFSYSSNNHRNHRLGGNNTTPYTYYTALNPSATALGDGSSSVLTNRSIPNSLRPSLQPLSSTDNYHTFHATTGNNQNQRAGPSSTNNLTALSNVRSSLGTLSGSASTASGFRTHGAGYSNNNSNAYPATTTSSGFSTWINLDRTSRSRNATAANQSGSATLRDIIDRHPPPTY